MSELYHHGTKGMRWGIRRYQNADGTLTDAGRRRYARELKDNQRKKKENRLSYDLVKNPEAWVKADRENSKQALNEGRNAANSTSSAVGKIARMKRSKAASQIDLSNMTNKELQDAITRMNLEKQYKSLKTENIATGADTVADVLSIAGDVLAVTGSAVGLAIAITALKNGRG